MKIYSGPLSMFGAKAEIAAHEKGIAFDLEMVPFNMRTLYDPKHPDVLRINPKRQVPVLIDGDLEIFDSTQIFEYLEDAWPSPALWPAAPRDRARARLLELKSDEVFFPHVIRLMGLKGAGNHPDAGPSRDGIEGYYREMNRVLEGRDYLAGTYSHADIAFYMAQFFAARMAVPMTSALANLSAWRVRVGERAAVRRVVGAMSDFLRGEGRPVPDFA
ncbi:MAG TPA: glutathione S-transferase family protein [Vineibacter sp.]|nr:glutathione S-transferase family protein [Vineibacter sp.]